MKKVDLSSRIESIPKPELSNTQNFDEKPEEIQKDLLQNAFGDKTPSVGTNHDPEEIWKIVKEHLRMNISERDLQVWYEGVYIESISNGVATLSCDNVLKRERIESYHKSFIRNKIQEIIGYRPDLMITIRTSTTKETPKKEANDKYEYYNPSNEQGNLFVQQPGTQDVDKPQATPNTNLNHKYTLSNFIVGNSNQLAHAVAQSTIDNLGSLYNPVFFYGPSGVGKTHLMQGIGNAVIERNPTAKVYYVPIETFMNEMIEAIRTSKNEEFRKKYRPADVLIIDDIQFISTYKKTKEELFNTFNALYEANKQIVIASDRPPNEIDNLPDRLRTRFQGGMVVDIQSPDLETRIAILQQEAQLNNMEVPSELLMFIAQNVENSVRELQGAMIKVITLTKINGEIPTLDNLAKMLQVDIDSKRRRVSPDDVIESVSKRFDVTKKDIVGSRRTAYIATARQVVMYILREELELPLEKVAQTVNRKDHTTVLHACEKIENLIEKDKRMKEKIDDCMEIFTV